MTAPTPAFFMLSSFESRVILPYCAAPARAGTASTKTRASSFFFIDYFAAAFLGAEWHLLQSVSGKAILPWHLPHHSPCTIPTILIGFEPLAGTNIWGWQTSHLSQ